MSRQLPLGSLGLFLRTLRSFVRCLAGLCCLAGQYSIIANFLGRIEAAVPRAIESAWVLRLFMYVSILLRFQDISSVDFLVESRILLYFDDVICGHLWSLALYSSQMQSMVLLYFSISFFSFIEIDFYCAFLLFCSFALIHSQQNVKLIQFDWRASSIGKLS